jgi:hypothetical protein
MGSDADRATAIDLGLGHLLAVGADEDVLAAVVRVSALDGGQVVL